MTWTDGLATIVTATVVILLVSIPASTAALIIALMVGAVIVTALVAWWFQRRRVNRLGAALWGYGYVQTIRTPPAEETYSRTFFQSLWHRIKGVTRAGWQVIDQPDGWKVVKRPDGSTALLDPGTIEYLQSAAPQPTQSSLNEMLDRTRACRLIEGGASGGRPLGTKTLLEVREPADLAQLREKLRIEDGSADHCMCHGDPTLEFFDESGGSLAVISFQHGQAIRWSAWKDDAALVDGLSLLNWLAARGVEYPLRQYERMLER